MEAVRVAEVHAITSLDSSLSRTYEVRALGNNNVAGIRLNYAFGGPATYTASGASSTFHLYSISYRKNIGFDVNLGSSHQNKVAIHRWEGNSQQSSAAITYALHELDVSTTVVILDTMEADGTYVWTGLKLTFREEQSVANGDPYDAAAVDVRSPSNKDPNTS